MVRGAGCHGRTSHALQRPTHVLQIGQRRIQTAGAADTAN